MEYCALHANHMAMDPIMHFLHAATITRPYVKPIVEKLLENLARKSHGPFELTAGTLWRRLSGIQGLKPVEEGEIFKLMQSFMEMMMDIDLLSYTPTPPGKTILDLAITKLNSIVKLFSWKII